MRLNQFNSNTGKVIEAFASSNSMITAIAHLSEGAQVSCMNLGLHGRNGFHQAGIPPLFLVVHGAGSVRGDEADFIPVSAGVAVFWDKGEWRETTTDTGLMAIIIEGEGLDLSQYLPEVKNL